MEMKLLPLNDSVKIVCMVNTVCASACDSEIRFFSTQWQELPKQDYMKLPSVEAFYLPVDSLKEDFLLLREKADMELLKATLSPDSAVLSIAYTTPDYLAKSEREKLTVYIKKECMDKWGLYDESYKIAADSDLLVRYLYEADLKVYYLNKYIVKMRMGGLSTDAGKSKLKWAEDLRMYKSHGIKPISALKGKILSKIPQFIEARLPWSEIPEAEEESLIQPAAANKKE